MKTNRIPTVLLSLILAFSGTVSAQTVPNVIHYQGKLMDGTNLFSGTVPITFRLYDAPTGGMFPQCASTGMITVVDGLYTAVIGEHITFGSLDNALFFSAEVWLEVEIDGQVITPRERLAAVPFARLAAAMPANSVNLSMIQDNAINFWHIGNNQVRANHIQAGAVTGPKIADGSVSNHHLAANAVTGPKIANATISGEKLQASTISNAHLAANSVTGPKIASGAVSNNQLATAAVTGAKIADGAVAARHLAPGACATNLATVLADIEARLAALEAEVFAPLFSSSVLLTKAQMEQINIWYGNATQKWERIFHRNTDGASAAAFHTHCDSQGPTIVVLSLSNGYLIGGYAASQWNGTGYSGNSTCFLFSLTTNFKHVWYRYGNYQYNHPNLGPTWGGGHDLYVNGTLSSGYANLGYDYMCRTGSYGSSTCQDDFAGSHSFDIADMEVFRRR